MRDFRLTIDPASVPRTTTRAQWKEMQHWLRDVARLVQAAIWLEAI